MIQLSIPGPHLRVAALYVQTDGVYATMPDVDPWPQERDARTYPGELPVVAHPPCATWGRYHQKAGGLGNDSGCFAAALASTRRWGGVIEHPANSQAWDHFDMPKPMEGMDAHGGWTLAVFQSWWGHTAIKPTWLYIVGTERTCIYPGPVGGGESPSGDRQPAAGAPEQAQPRRVPRRLRPLAGRAGSVQPCGGAL